MQEGDGGNQEFTYTTTKSVDTQEVQPQAPEQHQPTPINPEQSVVWQASEFIHHEKDNNWFLLLGLAAILVCVVVYFVSRSIFSTAVVLVAIVAFGVTALQKPRTIRYSLQPHEISVGDKKYRYEDFRSFNIVQEGGLFSIVLQPTRRFMPSLIIYFDQSDGDRIFEVLSSQIPHEEKQADGIDRFLKRIRF